MHVVVVDRAGAKSIWELMGHIAARCIAYGGRVTLVMWNDGRTDHTHDVPDGVEVIDIRVPPKRRIWDLVPQHLIFAREFRQVLHRLKPDIVHTNFAVPSIVARWMAAREGVPVIISTQHELYGSMRRHYRWGLRVTEHYCAAVVYVSQAVARSFGRAGKAPEGASPENSPKHVVIPNGVDIGKIHAAIADADERVSGRIVCAGRMVPIKGQQLLIEALPVVVRQHPHLRLHLIGSGPMEDALRRRVDELGLTVNVAFLGWKPHDDVLREMATAELVVVPSSMEGFGLVIAEALVCGTTLLMSDIPVFHEVLDAAGATGRFFPRGDATALADSLVEFPFAMPGDHVAAKAPPAAELQRLSAQTMADAYVSLYRELMTGDNE